MPHLLQLLKLFLFAPPRARCSSPVTGRFRDQLFSISAFQLLFSTGKDKWGLSWQITPIALTKAVTDPDRAVAKRAFDAMMQMNKIDIAAIEAARRA